MVDQRVMHVNPLHTFAQTHNRAATRIRLSEKNANAMPYGKPFTSKNRIPERSTVAQRQDVRLDRVRVPLHKQHSDIPPTTSSHEASESMQMHSQVLISIVISGVARGSVGRRVNKDEELTWRISGQAMSG